MKNNFSIKLSAIIVFLLLFISYKNQAQNNCTNFEPFTFGVIADCQCGSLDCNSVPKLEEAVDFFNTTDIAFCAHLGDFIMNGFQHYPLVQPVYESLNAPHYYVFGNHEWDIPEAEKPGLVNMLNMPDYYYDIKVENFRFIFIESCELAFYNEAAHPELVNERDSIYEIYGGQTNSGGLSQNQLAFIEATIAQTVLDDENVILFGHHPIYPVSNKNIWNDVELINILEQYSNVVAYMNGHNHAGDYAIKNGIHYVTFKAMLSHTNSFSLIEVVEDTLNVRGFGEADDYALTFTTRIVVEDDDNDTICNEDDICPNFDDNLIGTICNDNNACTLNDVYTINCNCKGIYTDTDNDGICDANDLCPNFNDTIDIDNDNLPDACDDCFDNLSINDIQTIVAKVYSVEDYIVSDAIIMSNANITFNAGDSINLVAGFEVQLNVAFEAKIEGCVN